MKEKIKNLNNKKIVITTLCAFAIVLLLGLTYAIWSRTFNQTGINTSTYDCFDINFSENVEGISMENGYPITDEEGLKTESYEVTITNTCKTVASYNVVLNKLNTSTLDDNHVKIAVNGDVEYLNKMKSTTSNIANTASARIINTGVLGEGQERTISVQNWMAEETTKEEGTNKTFAYKITIEATAGKNILAAKVLSGNLKSEIPDFAAATPVKKQKSKIEENAEVNLSAEKIDNITIGTGYTFNEGNGVYTLTGSQTNQSYNASSIGKYTCNTEKVGCKTLYKIKEVNETDSTYNYVIKADKYTSEETEEIIDKSGLYKTQDEDGDSYYFRGKVNNNYVSLGMDSEGNAILWRIVRINGDGSIRLITEEDIGVSKYNTNQEPRAKTVGYTYDNTHICTKSNPCISDYNEESKTFDTVGTNSDIKTYLEEWYKTTLNEYNNKIVLGKYCNDTTYRVDGDNNRYGAYDRVRNYEPTLQCSDTSETYGGSYKLKVGLLTTDEMNMAGLIFYSTDETNEWSKVYAEESNYLYYPTYWWSASPINSTSSIAVVNNGNNGRISNNDTRISRAVRPVINLKSDILITGGDGSKTNPYIVK